MDSSTGVLCLQNLVQHKNWVKRVKDVFLFNVTIRRNLGLKFQKVDKDGGQKLFRANGDIVQKRFSLLLPGFHLESYSANNSNK